MVEKLENCPVVVRLQSDGLNISALKGIIKQYYKYCERQLVESNTPYTKFSLVKIHTQGIQELDKKSTEFFLMYVRGC